MDKTDTLASLNHNITINERKNIIISGVKKINNFDSEEFLLETTMGNVIIKGKELEIIKLDTYQGSVSIKGVIVSLTYADSGKKEEGVFSKLFK
ncbi:MAG: sporulation protein YabP [Bacilli bacterium]